MNLTLSRTERTVLQYIVDGHHTIDELQQCTGHTREKIAMIVTWLAHDGLVTAATNDDHDGVWIEATEDGIAYCITTAERMWVDE